MKDLKLLGHFMEIKRFMQRSSLNPLDVNRRSLNAVSKLLYDWLIMQGNDEKLRSDMKELAFSFVGEYRLKSPFLYRGVKVNQNMSKEEILVHLLEQDMTSFTYDIEVAEMFAGEKSRHGYQPLKEGEVSAIIRVRTSKYTKVFDLYRFFSDFLAKFGKLIPSALANKIEDFRFEQEVLLFSNKFSSSNFEVSIYESDEISY